ncbi:MULTISPECIES: RagB/SusD family nutrient uptake outer membrane protein [unclassified Chitinophaga]|uniref:RagB/SusD family nutrient uptake outer membrane protein n=1 Tax=unclassified Chitinophaga TaxID=2619133 RepID=UPI0030100AB6
MIFAIKKISILKPKYSQLILISFILFHISCKKLLDVNPPTTSINGNNIYTNDQTASAVLTGIYTNISATGITNSDLSAIGFITGLSGDELTLYSGSADLRLKAYYQNNLRSITSYTEFWTKIYKILYTANLSIEGLNNSTLLTLRVKQQLLGEAKFIRAFCFFYLVNLYGEIPISTTTNYTVNNVLVRNSIDQAWLQIITDLKDAKELLSTTYLDGTLIRETPERIRPTKWSAIALLARSYLYTKDWKNAEEQATEIINKSDLYKLDSLDQSFLMNNSEAIWQLQPVNIGSNTEDAKTYIIPPTGPSFLTPAYISLQLINSFETNDQRKVVWIDTVTVSGILYYYAYKYKSGKLDEPLTEYNTILRLGEQYLIRAEARAQQDNPNGSRDDLNVIRVRAGLEKLNITEKKLLLTAIYHERQVELFTEWGHRWLDLKRTNTVDDIMSQVTPKKGGIWNANWKLFPVPSYDIVSNSNLYQNPGY